MRAFVLASQMLHYENNYARPEPRSDRLASHISEKQMAPDFSVQGKIVLITGGAGELAARLPALLPRRARMSWRPI